jgi:hypothetical protein
MGRMIAYLREHAPWAIFATTAVLLIGVGLFALPPSPHLPADSEHQRSDPAYRPGGPACDPARISSLPRIEAARVAGDCADKAEQHRQTEADLVQQRRAADAAYLAAVEARYQSGVILWGTICGAITLLAAIFAAHYARRASVIADRALAAESAPEVVIEKIEIGDLSREDQVLFEYRLKNFGKGVAYIRRYGGILRIASGPDIDAAPLVDFDAMVEAYWPIPPGSWFGTAGQGSTVTLTKEDREGVLSGAFPAYALGRVEYVDSSGREYVHRYIYVYVPEAKRFIPAPVPEGWQST